MNQTLSAPEGGEGRGEGFELEILDLLLINLFSDLVGTRSTASLIFQRRRGCGGTRPYQVQGFNAQILIRGILTQAFLRGEREKTT